MRNDRCMFASGLMTYRCVYCCCCPVASRKRRCAMSWTLRPCLLFVFHVGVPWLYYYCRTREPDLKPVGWLFSFLVWKTQITKRNVHSDYLIPCFQLFVSRRPLVETRVGTLAVFCLDHISSLIARDVFSSQRFSLIEGTDTSRYLLSNVAEVSRRFLFYWYHIIILLLYTALVSMSVLWEITSRRYW